MPHGQSTGQRRILLKPYPKLKNITLLVKSVVGEKLGFKFGFEDGELQSRYYIMGFSIETTVVTN
jgi:hypothetical protein